MTGPYYNYDMYSADGYNFKPSRFEGATKISQAVGCLESGNMRPNDRDWIWSRRRLALGLLGYLLLLLLDLLESFVQERMVEG